MLFDLRSRGRRTTVRGVYLTLAVLIGGGLILFGVGTGVGGGGLLNAFSGGGGNSGQAVSSAEKSALRATRLHPQDPGAWAKLVQARSAAANQECNFTATVPTCTASGKAELGKLVQAWQRYSTLTTHPDPGLALLSARAYTILGQYGNAADSWEIISSAQSNNPHAFECLAVSSYAASQTRTGELAAAKALTLLPKSSRTRTKQILDAAKLSPKTAQQIAQSC